MEEGFLFLLSIKLPTHNYETFESYVKPYIIDHINGYKLLR